VTNRTWGGLHGGHASFEAQVRASIRDIPDFPKPGVTFKDITPLLNDPVAFASVVDALAGAFITAKIDRVLGVEARGFILAAPVAYRLGAGFVPVRKAGKLPWRSSASTSSSTAPTCSECAPRQVVRPGERVLIVDDVAGHRRHRGGHRTAGRAGSAARSPAWFLLELAFLGGASQPRTTTWCVAAHVLLRHNGVRLRARGEHPPEVATVDRVLPWRRHSAPLPARDRFP
jgi:adenine phosphoribosyltransferase